VGPNCDPFDCPLTVILQGEEGEEKEKETNVSVH
jgi:hypothetical protein